MNLLVVKYPNRHRFRLNRGPLDITIEAGTARVALRNLQPSIAFKPKSVNEPADLNDSSLERVEALPRVGIARL